MRFAGWTVLLAVVWMLLYGEFTLASLLTGLLAGVAVTGFSRLTVARDDDGGRDRPRSFPGPTRIVRGSFAALRLLGHFLLELTRANLILSRDILRPKPDFHPGIVAFDVSELGPRESVFMATLVSLTPGTITVDLDRCASVLHVHSVYAEDVGKFRDELQEYVDLILAIRGDRPGRKGSGVR